MKKEELKRMTVPLSPDNLQKLKDALSNEEITRADIPSEVLESMGCIWGEEMAELRRESIRLGIMGEYD